MSLLTLLAFFKKMQKGNNSITILFSWSFFPCTSLFLLWNICLIMCSSCFLPSLQLILDCTVFNLNDWNSSVQLHSPDTSSLSFQEYRYSWIKIFEHWTFLSPKLPFFHHHSIVWLTYWETRWTLNSVMCNVNVFDLTVSSYERFFFWCQDFCNNVYEKREN